VELALCLPLALLVLAALLELGIFVTEQVRLWHAAREAARVAVVDPSPQAPRAAAERAGPTPVHVSVTPGPSGRRRGDPLTVSLSYRHEGTVPVLEDLFATMPLEAQATMRIEQP
jgi:hypothetical protein